MKITDLQVDGFGVWKGLSVESLSPELTVFYGQNEAGKTTLMHFIRSMLFGFSPDRLDRYVPPVYGGLAGGSMSVACPAGPYELQRHVDPAEPAGAIGELAITHGRDGTTHGAGHLGLMTSGIDETIFNNVFAIGLREIQELGTLNSTDAAEHLYKLTSGLDRVSLIDVMRDVHQDRNALWSLEGGAKSSRIGQLLQRRRDLEREIDELRQRTRRWSKLAADSQEIQQQLTQLAEKLSELERENRRIEVALQVAERWQARRVLDQQIAELNNLPDERDLSLAGLQDLNQRIAKAEERIEHCRRQRQVVRGEADQLKIDRGLWAAAPKVDALHEHLPWIDALQQQVDRLKGEINGIQLDLGGEFDGLGTHLKLHKKQLRDLNEATLAQLRGAAKELAEQRDQLARAADESQRAVYELEEHQERLTAKSSVRQDGELTIEDHGQLVNRLRRRIELEAKIDKMNQAKQDLELEIDDVVADQVLPVNKLTIIGIVFVIGIVFLGFGIWLGLAATTQIGSLLIVLSGVFGLLSFGLKYHWEGIARAELDDFRSQFEMIRQQLRRAQSEREELDKSLPAGSANWEGMLKDAELHLQRIEDLVPLENRVKVARQNVEEARRLQQKQQNDVDAAEARWKSALRGLSLPETLEPNQLKEVSQRSERIAAIHTRLEQYQHELNERNRELQTVTSRIDQLLDEVGLDYQSTDPAQRLQQLKNAINEQRRLVSRRKELLGKYRSWRGQQNKSQRELDALLGRKQRALAIVGAHDEEQYRQFALQHEQLKKLQEKRRQLQEQIMAALGAVVTLQHVDSLLEQFGPSGLEKRWGERLAESEQLKKQQAQLQEQRGKISQEIASLGDDRRLEEARLELHAVSEQLGRTERDWQVLAISSQILETLRATYEAKRQPETLREASYFLERLTSGQYTRIWTRMVGTELLVDHKSNETFRVELLSRGTREAVYLSLRLALVGAYARRGATLPMVLDDVLVNFDSERARAAAQVLRDFAANGYQVLMFTCHDHIRDMFDDLQADVRVLPHHKDVVQSQATPYRYHRPSAGPAEWVVAAEPETPQPVDHDWSPVRPSLELGVDELDPELQYELAAIESDEERRIKLRDQLVYVADSDGTTLDLRGEDEVWTRRLPQRTA